MGFCLFNNIAIAAALLLEEGERVAIIDWDVHHGNGTQNSFFAEERVLYISLHESPFYPGTGQVHEVGRGSAQGTVVNVPLPAGTTGATYGDAWTRLVNPVVAQFSPDWILVSAGYDAHRSDPLAGMRLDAADFGRMSAMLGVLGASQRMVYFLEGGYDLDAITASVAATIQGGLGRDHTSGWPEVTEDPAVTAAVRAQSGFWEL